MRYVIDCSVVVKWFVPEDLSDVAESVLVRYEAGEISLVAPDTIAAELGHSLRKHVLAGSLGPGQALSSLAEFVGMPFERASSESLATEALKLSLAHRSTFYDALYMALSQREDLFVLTADEPMTRVFAPLNRTVNLSTLV